jgi:hypothetical protein
MKPISREEAKALGLARYFTGKACGRGHVAERWLIGNCVACGREHDRKRYTGDRQKSNIKKSRAYFAANREKHATNGRKWRVENREKVRARKREYYVANREAHMLRANERRAAKRNATPPLTAEQKRRVAAVYAAARTLSELIGLPYHVDHRIALAAGGQHVFENLQIVLGAENIAKGAKPAEAVKLSFALPAEHVTEAHIKRLKP